MTSSVVAAREVLQYPHPSLKQRCEPIPPGDELGREGCLSIPDLTANVRRATWTRVEAVLPAGETVTIESDGFEARALLHELDHLDGILFLDRIASRADVFARKRYA